MADILVLTSFLHGHLVIETFTNLDGNAVWNTIYTKNCLIVGYNAKFTGQTLI